MQIYKRSPITSQLVKPQPYPGVYRGVLAAITACFVTLLLSEAGYSSIHMPTLSQIPVFPGIEELTPADIQSDVQDFLTGSPAEATTASVRLDGYVLFRVADSAVAAEQRSQEIERRLQDLAQKGHSTPETLTVYWEPENESGQPIVYVNEDFLLAVTAADAELEDLQNLGIWAGELTQIIHAALIRYSQERQPEALWQFIRYGIGILIFTTLLSIGMVKLQQRLERQREHLQQQLADNTALTQNTTDLPPLNGTLRRQVMQRQKRNLIDIQRGGLILLQLSLWVSTLLLILGLFPQTRWLQPLLVNGLRLPLQLSILVLAVYALTRLGNMVVNRLCLFLQNQASVTPEYSQRLSLRLSTFAQVIRSIVTSTLVSIGILIGLALLGVNLTSLLAGAGLIGLGISLAAQSLIKDVINGFLIVLEDQYGVGDVIVVGEVAGFVETMDLRITQLRNEEGRLITIPNSQITIVQNLSKDWSRVDLMVTVAPSADIDQAIALIHRIADAMAADKQWQRLILESPLILGVDRLDHYGATIRIWIKTLPLKQWDVAREYRRRLKIAFDQANIPIGVPQQFVQIQTPEALLTENGRSTTEAKS